MKAMNVKVLASAVAVLSVVGLGLTQARAGARQKLECRGRALVDSYGFVVEGEILAQNALGLPAGPYSGAGRVEFDYDGTWSAIATYSINGAVAVETPLRGTWSVSSDCGFTLAQARFGVAKGTVVAGGNEIILTTASPGTTGTLRGVRVEPY